MKEYQQLEEEPSSEFTAHPLEDNLFEWHFTIKGPEDSAYAGGIYHGRIILPDTYPFKPPDIMILTPSGRFETSTKICLSVTGYHPDSWQASWGIRTVLIALRTFFPTDPKGAVGSLECPDSERKRLAKKSREWKCPMCKKCNYEYFPEEAARLTNTPDATPQLSAATPSTPQLSAMSPAAPAQAEVAAPPAAELSRRRVAQTTAATAQTSSAAGLTRTPSRRARTLTLLTVFVTCAIVLLLVRRIYRPSASQLAFS